MKKVILILLCISILLPLISCNKKEDIHSIDTQQLTNYGTRAEDDISKKVCFLNYEDILQRYRELLSDNRSNSNTQSPKEYSVKNDSTIENALQSTVINSYTAQMGYAIYDINNDAQDELVLMDDCYHIYAVFTQTNETPVLLDTFSLNNHYVSLDNNGIFYKTGYGKGEDHYTKIMKIGDGGNL